MGQQTWYQKLRSDFDLNGTSEIYFLKSEWESFDPSDEKLPISNTFIAYRLIFAIYFTTTLFLTIICTDTATLWPIYITHWSYLLQTIYAIVAFIVVIGGKWEEGQSRPWGQGQDEFIRHSHRTQVPGVTKLTWILFNVVTALSLFVTLVYWIGVYDGESRNTCETVSNYLLHAMNSLLALADVFIVAIPIRFVHSLFGFVVLATYLLFTILYEIAGGVYEGGGDYIYKLLNWKQSPTAAGIMVIVGLVGILGCHLVFAWVVTKGRTKLANKFNSSKYTPL